MKKLLSLAVALLICTAIWSQGFNYQAVARDVNGTILSNQNLSIEIAIYEGEFSNAAIYSELHDITTNTYGLFTLVVGKGIIKSAIFENIDWTTTSHFLGVRINTSTSFVDLGRTRLQSVPYSKFADVAEKVTDAKLSELSDVQTNALADGQVLKWNAASQTWEPANDNVATGSGASVNTTSRLTGDGSQANPLDLARQGAQNGQVMTWQNNNWQPATPPGTTYQAGTGIQILNNTISNTGDTNPNDDVTTSTTAGGDLSGTFSNLQIRPNAVGSNEIANGSIQASDLANGVIPSTLPPNGAAGGDLGGNYPNPLVTKLQGRTLSSNAPTNGQVLRWNGIQWIPSNENVQNFTAGTGIAIQNNTIINTGDTNPNDDITTTTNAGGDLSGNFTNLKVTRLQGRNISATAPATGQILTWNGSAWAAANSPLGEIVWRTNNDNAFYNTGNVGIGLNTPQNKLHIHNNTPEFGSPSNIQLTNTTTGITANDGLSLTLNSTVADYGLIGGLMMRENALLGFGTNNNYHLFLKQNGLLGLGTFSPDGKMDIRHNSTTTSPQLMLSEDATDYARLSMQSLGVANKYWTIAGRTQANDADSRLNLYYFNGTAGKDIISVRGNSNIEVNGDTKITGNLEVTNNTEVTGNATITGEVNRPKTGDANLVPICFGHVDDNGEKTVGTSNFTVKRNETGVYEITITGENFAFFNYITVVTPIQSGTVATVSSVNDKLLVRINTPVPIGAATNSNFNFIIYKP